MSIVLVGFGNHTQNKLIPALINLKIPITAIITNNKNCKTEIISKSMSSSVINKVGSQEYLMEFLI